MEDSKEGILNIDDCIAEALDLKIIFFEKIPSRPTALCSLSTCSKSSETGEETEDDDED